VALAWWCAAAGDPYDSIMLIALAWLRLDFRRRWRSLAALTLLIAVSAAVVLTAVAGARRGHSAFDRLWARTLPATVAVLPNQSGFNWAPVANLPQVAAIGQFAVFYGISVDGLPGASVDFPPVNAATRQTLERPVVLDGRLADPARLDEVNVTPNFLAWSGRRVGDTLTLRLASVAQTDAGIDATSGQPLRGPALRVRIVGVTRAPFTLENVGDPGGLYPPQGLFARYSTEIMGTRGTGITFINALIRLKGGQASIPAFRAGLARVSGRSDIDVWDNYAVVGDPVHKMTGYEAICLLAFGLAALLAAIFLVGQAMARHVSAAVAELDVLRAVGLTRWQAVASAVGGPLLAAMAGATLAVAAAIAASRWMPMGIAALAEPSPGTDADWLVLGPGWAITVLVVVLGAAAATRLALTAARSRKSPPASVIARAAARAGLPVPAVVGARFALEPGRGATAVPVRPALAGVVGGVLGVLAALTFSAGIGDAASHPERYGQTWQLTGFFGFSGQDFGPVTRIEPALAADRDVTGFLDVRFSGAQSGRVSLESFTYAPVAGKQVPVVLTGGRMPASASEIVLAPTTARLLGVRIGSVVPLRGGTGAARAMTVTGTGFVPAGPHNSYDAGAWLTPAGYGRLFGGARYSFKFHAGLVTLRPGASPLAVAQRMAAEAAKVKGGQGLTFTPPDPITTMEDVNDMAVLPLALAAFLVLLAVGAVGHALALAVRRRRRELAVLRTLGLTGSQSRAVVVTQASLLAVIGLAFGIPLGLAVGRGVWREVAGFVPLAYYPPTDPRGLALIVPVTLVAANVLALWPGRSAARLRPGQVLRAE
jgi:FtsX-like permease family